MIAARSNIKGFTMIELMIATAVFSVILLVVLASITQIGRIYYKGISVSRTQEATRSIVDRIAEQIQFGANKPSISFSTIAPDDGTARAFCINSDRYVYLTNRQVADTNNASQKQSRHALWFDQNGAAGAGCNTTGVTMTNATPSAGGSELLPEGMRLVDFAVQDLTGGGVLWKVRARVVYGDQDLLFIPSGADGFKRAECKGATTGSQFCAVSELEVVVSRRVL